MRTNANYPEMTVCRMFCICTPLHLLRFNLHDLYLFIDIIAGDFNAKSPLWGNSGFNNRGRQLEDILLNLQILSCINTGEPPYIGAQSMSAIDLIICKQHIAWKCDWQPLQDLSGSNHLPIIINCHHNHSLPPTTPNPRQNNHSRFNHHININKTDWNKFASTSTKLTTNITNIESDPFEHIKLSLHT